MNAFSLLLSFRQKILIEDFAPFVVIAVPIMVSLFLHSLRVRLPRFQFRHKTFAYIAITVLVFTSLVILFNKPLYAVLPDSQKHFAYKYHHAKEIAQLLKNDQIDNIFSNDEKLIKRLQFYGIHEGYQYFITTKELYTFTNHYTIEYNHHKIMDLFVTKVNNKENF